MEREKFKVIRNNMTTPPPTYTYIATTTTTTSISKQLRGRLNSPP